MTGTDLKGQPVNRYQAGFNLGLMAATGSAGRGATAVGRGAQGAVTRAAEELAARTRYNAALLAWKTGLHDRQLALPGTGNVRLRPPPPNQADFTPNNAMTKGGPGGKKPNNSTAPKTTPGNAPTRTDVRTGWPLKENPVTGLLEPQPPHPPRKISGLTGEGTERQAQIRANNPQRNVGDINKIVAEGRTYYDIDDKTFVYISGERVVVLNAEGKFITGFKNSQSNTTLRTSGTQPRWIEIK